MFSYFIADITLDTGKILCSYTAVLVDLIKYRTK